MGTVHNCASSSVPTRLSDKSWEWSGEISEMLILAKEVGIVDVSPPVTDTSTRNVFPPLVSAK
jgi:hypothetical protein